MAITIIVNIRHGYYGLNYNHVCICDYDCGSPGFSQNSSSIGVACNSANLACSIETAPAGKPILLYTKAACHIATATKHVLLKQNRLDVGPQLQTINLTAMSICWPEIMKSSLELKSVVRPGGLLLT